MLLPYLIQKNELQSHELFVSLKKRKIEQKSKFAAWKNKHQKLCQLEPEEKGGI